MTSGPPDAAPAPDPQIDRLIEAARRELAHGGLRAMSFRRLGDAVGATSGALAYHLGAKADILSEVVTRERLRNRRWHDEWLERLDGLERLDRQALAAILEQYLDAMVQGEARLTQLIWMDLALRAPRDAEVAALVAPWLAERRAFWARLFEGRIEDAAIWAGLAAAYVTDEGFNSLVVGDDPDYRLLRRMAIDRLSSRLGRDGLGREPLFSRLVRRMDRRLGLPAGDVPDAMGPGPKRDAALAACHVLVDSGAEALTHRAVAERAGLSRSAVGYYFRTAADLFKAAISGVYLIADGRGDPPSPPPGVDPIPWRGQAVARGELAVVLAAARDPALSPYVIDQRRWRGVNYVRLLRSRGYSGLDALDGQTASMIATGQTILSGVDGDDRRDLLVSWLIARHKD
ncbi:helix-turn-helix domain-containing protein [Caulobacter sp. 602-1]|uniref:helix-turn-helix domain-containing protein n=1 Tax=Caulobacter sp. 602-1 TaxID=2492472 RepID=UPI000F644EC6|nr:helix-turn-helix domain-containing protein [Caulobacter sp. 602-1]RRN65200.1 TetR/AcrR family transcriptional regulator [Caulobacter sp. 602-1]